MKPERVRSLVRKTGLLEFRLVRFPKGGGGGAKTREEVLSIFTGDLPAELEILEGGMPPGLAGEAGEKEARLYYAVERRPVIDGHGIRSARPTLGLYDKPIVTFQLTPEAAEVFSQVTGDNVGSGLAIVFDGEVLSAPVINARIGDSGIIEGDFTREEVQDMAAMMASGPLPSQISIVEEKVVRPSPSARHARRVTFGGTAFGVVLAGALFVLALRRR
jgi:preprotein translocase subunit SecD